MRHQWMVAMGRLRLLLRLRPALWCTVPADKALVWVLVPTVLQTVLVVRVVLVVVTVPLPDPLLAAVEMGLLT